MTEDQKNKRLERINDAFDICVNGIKSASMAVFGISSWQELIGKKFYFFVNNDKILEDIQDINEIFPDEAFLGQVTGINFRFAKHEIIFPDKYNIGYIEKALSIFDFQGNTCRPIIQTTIGILESPWGENSWAIYQNGETSLEGDVLFI